MSDLDEVKIRILNADEFHREDLLEIFAAYESNIPNPQIATIQVAEKDGKIVGFGVLQPRYHAEPIYVKEEFRHTDLHKRIIESLLKPFESIKGLSIYVFSPNSRIFKLALRFGFKPTGWEVLVRKF